MKNILAVDATGDGLSVALEAGGRVFAARRSAKTPHDEALLPAVDSLLKRAKLYWEDLDAVAAAAGPGRFTGIRIGMAFAAMAGLRLKIPALALSRLEAAALRHMEAALPRPMARSAAPEKHDAQRALAALPGWKGEVYHQPFARKGSALTPLGVAAWSAAEEWPKARAEAEARGLAVAYGDTDARDLLAVARRRLEARRIPPFQPFYLKPAGYEKPRR